MKSKTAADLLHHNACHVCDGVLEDGLRIGCDDLVYMSAARDAVEKAEEELILHAIDVLDDILSSTVCNGADRDYTLRLFTDKLMINKEEI